MVADQAIAQGVTCKQTYEGIGTRAIELLQSTQDVQGSHHYGKNDYHDAQRLEIFLERDRRWWIVEHWV